jgi:hypothetical protein
MGAGLQGEQSEDFTGDATDAKTMVETGVWGVKKEVGFCTFAAINPQAPVERSYQISGSVQ